jgi:hypothetical protein
MTRPGTFGRKFGAQTKIQNVQFARKARELRPLK